MSETKSAEGKQLQYVYGARLKVCHAVADRRQATVETGCAHSIKIVNTGRKLTLPGAGPPESMRLCKKCEEALVWWRYNGTWRKS